MIAAARRARDSYFSRIRDKLRTLTNHRIVSPMEAGHFWLTLIEGAIYDIAKYSIGSMIIVAGLEVILNRVFKLIESRREKIIFGIGSFVVVFSFFYMFGAPRIAPNIEAQILQAVPGNLDTHNYTIVSLNIINKGSMPTILRNWRLSATQNGIEYTASLPIMPETFSYTFNNDHRVTQPESITYEKGDEIRDKALTPVAVGAMLSGILFADFENVDPTIFKAGVVYRVSFDDVMGVTYYASFVSTANRAIIAQVPGIKLKAICPADHKPLALTDDDIKRWSSH